MSTRKSLVLTVLGVDQPGLVEKISQIVVNHQGNWLESYLSNMAGYFGGMVHVELPEECCDAVIKQLELLEDEGLDVLIRTADETQFESAPPTDVELELLGQDRPGIVNQITEALARHKVNVEALETEFTSAPMSGTEMFRARALLNLPVEVTLHEIQSDLEEIAADLMVDLTVRPLDESTS